MASAAMTLEEVHRLFEKDTFAKHLGIEVVEVAQDYAAVTMPFDHRHRNGMGQTHGGAIFALADIAFAAASNAYDVICVNAQSSIAYVSPGKVGPLRGEARAISKGRKLITFEVRICDATEALVAVATVVGYVKGAPKAVPPNTCQNTCQNTQ